MPSPKRRTRLDTGVTAPAKTVHSKTKSADTDRLLGLYRDMLLIRRFEERTGQMYGQGKIGGFCHLYMGQEAVVVGVQSSLEEGDSVITAYRDHGHILAVGIDPKNVMAELFGRKDGCSKGKGGSMHMFSRDKHFFGGHGIVGAHVSIATGLAFTHAYREDGGVCVCYFGDGAANQGQVAESFNMAAIWKLPILFVVENNGYAMGTSQARASSGDICKRGEPYGIGGRQVDGMDVVAVREAAVKAVRDIRSGKGAQILEMMTYRYKGHSMSDPATYRTREEVDKAKDERDPIDRLNAQLLDAGIDKDDLEAIDTKIKETIKIVVAFAEKSPEPDEKELWTDVLAKD